MSDSRTPDEESEKKPRTRRVTFASPITPLRTSDGGLTSPASSICSSSSSSSVTLPAPLHSILKKPKTSEFASTNPSDAQSGSSNSSVSQSGSSNSSAAQSGYRNSSAARSINSSAAQSGSSNSSVVQSGSSNSSAAQSGSRISSVAQSVSINASTAQSVSINSSVAQSSSSNSSAAQSGSSSSSVAQSGSSNSSAAQSGSKSTSAAQSSSTSSSGGQSSSSSSSGGQSKSSSSPGGKPPSSSKGGGQSKSSTSAGVQSGSTSRGGGRSVTNRTGRSSAMHSSTAKPLKSSARSTVTAPVVIRPAGNLFPSGVVKITGMTQGDLPRTKVLGSGTHSYGVGNVVPRPVEPKPSPVKPGTSRGVPALEILWKQALAYTKPEEVKKAGNEMFKKGCFTEALRLYDRAIELSPHKATYHNNRAAALVGLARIGEALLASEEAVRFDPQYVKAQHRLASLFFRLGQIDNARKHFSRLDQSLDPKLGKLLQEVEEHLKKCEDARKVNDWKIVLKEADAAITSGADYSPQLVMCKVEALLKLFRVDEARRVASLVPKVEPNTTCLSKSQIFDMICGAYTAFAKSHMDLALGRFENAATAAEKAADIDPKSNEVEMWYKRVKSIVSARDRGDNLYESERYTEASTAYTECLKFDPSNAILYCKRAVCFYRVKNWKSSIADCNQAQVYQPRYTQPLVLRAAIHFKLERWAEAVKDYAILRRQLPYDKGIAASLFHSQVALKKSRGDQVINMEFRGDVEEICSLEDFKAALTRPGVSIVEFMKDSDQQCKQMSAFMDALCIRYPSLHYLKVEIGRCAEVRRAENVKVVPTFKIYKNGKRVKEMVCSSRQVLEDSVRYYSFLKPSNNKT